MASEPVVKESNETLLHQDAPAVKKHSSAPSYTVLNTSIPETPKDYDASRNIAQ
jgi:hypothetical protein